MPAKKKTEKLETIFDNQNDLLDFANASITNLIGLGVKMEREGAADEEVAREYERAFGRLHVIMADYHRMVVNGEMTDFYDDFKEGELKEVGDALRAFTKEFTDARRFKEEELDNDEK